MWLPGLLRVSRALTYQLKAQTSHLDSALARGLATAAAGGSGASAAAAPDFGCVVVGAGVVGLACARAVAQAGQEVLIVDEGPAIGTGASSRNSEVIHAGLYYPPGSLKARLCVEGRRELYEYCRDRGVAHRRLGKLVVATQESQHEQLERIAAAGAANGVEGLRLLAAREAQALEPHLRCTAALLSPSTGIIDSHGLMEALLADAEAARAALALNSRVVSADVDSGGGGGLKQLEVRDVNTGEVSRVTTRWLVNAAGLGAQAVAAATAGLPPGSVPPLHLARGCYFSLSGARAPFSRLIYPVPEPGGLGVHLTLDLGGQARFGPDVEWVDRVGYEVDPHRAAVFYPAVRAYWPGLPDGALAPAYAGVRAKVSGPGAPAGDFVLQGLRDHGVPGLVNLFGIESPGLTSSLAVARAVLRMLEGGDAAG